MNSMDDTTGADRVVFLGQSTIPLLSAEFSEGGYIANDDRDGDTSNDMARVYINDNDFDLHFGDYAYIKLRTN